MIALLRDIRYSVIAASRRPLWRLAIVAILGVGIGGVASIGLFVNALFFRTLPVDNPSDLVWIGSLQANGADAPVSLAAGDLVSQAAGIEQVAGYTGGLLLTSEHNGVLRRATVDAVSRTYFRTLRVSPLFGSVFDPYRGASDQVAVVSYDYWQRVLGGTKAALGTTLSIEGTAFRVIGITPQSFTGITVGESFDVAIPLDRLLLVLTGEAHDAVHTSARLLIARRRSGTPTSELRSELAAKWPSILVAVAPPELAGASRDRFLARRLVVEPLETGLSFLRRPYGNTSIMFLELSLVFLLVVTLGLSGIWTSQLRSREAEWRVRVAVGAAPGDLARLGLCEMLLLCFAGAALGYLCASSGTAICERIVRDAMGGPVGLDLDGGLQLLGFVFVSALVVLAGAALAPLAILVRSVAGLRTHRGHPHALQRRVQASIVAAEVALTITMVFLAMRSARLVLDEYRAVPGFGVQGTLVAELMPQPAHARQIPGPAYYRELSDRIRALPGVTSVAFSFEVPGRAPYLAKTEVALEGTLSVAATPIVVSPGFFSALRMPLVAGRECLWTDDQGHEPVAVVSQNLAQALHGTAEVVGEHLHVLGPTQSKFRIIGVFPNARLRDIRLRDTNTVAMCGLQMPGGLQNSRALIATTRDAQISEHSLHDAVAGLGRDYVSDYDTLTDELSKATRPDRLTSISVVLYTAGAALLLCVALYVGLMQLVADRESEFAVRLALGASVRSVQWLAFRTVILALGAGVIAGVIGLPVVARIVPAPELGVLRVGVGVVAACLMVTTSLVAAAIFRPARFLRRLHISSILRTV